MGLLRRGIADARTSLRAAVSRIEAQAALEKSLDLRRLHDLQVEADYFTADIQNDIAAREQVAQAIAAAKLQEQQAQIISFDQHAALWPDQFHEKSTGRGLGNDKRSRRTPSADQRLQSPICNEWKGPWARQLR